MERPRAPRRRLSRWLAGCVGLALLAGCAAPAQSEVLASADTFVRSAPADACGILAPATLTELERPGVPCRQALADLALPRVTGPAASVVVAGHAAVVRYGSQTVFLALFDDGWRVTAAGCRHETDDAAVPYRCTLEGP